MAISKTSFILIEGIKAGLTCYLPVSFRGKGMWGVSSSSSYSNFPDVSEGSWLKLVVGGDAASCFFYVLHWLSNLSHVDSNSQTSSFYLKCLSL